MTAVWQSFPVTQKLAVQHRLHAARYANDPIAWVHDCIQWNDDAGPTDYQQRILQAIVDHERVAVRAPRGAGKTAPAAWAVLWFAATRDGIADWKIPTTAGAWRHLDKFLWPEIHRWSRRLRWDRIARTPWRDGKEKLVMSLQLDTGSAFAIASDNPDLLEGAHAPALMAIVDEGKSVPDASWDAIEGYFSDPGDKYALALSTPGGPAGRFYEIHTRRPGFEDWYPIHITLDEAIKGGRITRKWADQRLKQWGAESSVYQTQVLAEFGGEEDGLIPLAWVQAAQERWQELNLDGFQPSIVGVDVADSGDDQTAIALRDGWVIGRLVTFDTGDPLLTADRTRRLAPNAFAVVDSIGLGAGTLASLKRSGQASGFVASARTKRRDRTGEFGFLNLRAAAWWNLRELLDPNDGEAIALPPDDRLLGDLTAPRWREAAGGKIQIESKDDIRKRLGRSTDTGDAVVQAFWEEGRRPKLDGWSDGMVKQSHWKQ